MNAAAATAVSAAGRSAAGPHQSFKAALPRGAQQRGSGKAHQRAVALKTQGPKPRQMATLLWR